jgi:hypothetical protein
MKDLKTFLFNQPKKDANFSLDSIKEYLKRKETKVFALLSYWGAESVINIFTMVVLLLAANYALAAAVMAITLYQTYAVFGAVYEII